MLAKIGELLKDVQNPEKLELIYQIINLESKKSQHKGPHIPKLPLGKPPTPKNHSNWLRKMNLQSDVNSEMSGTTPRSGLFLSTDRELLQTLLSPENQSSSRAQSKIMEDSLQKLVDESWQNTRHVQLEDIINAGSSSQGGIFLFNEKEMITGSSPDYQGNHKRNPSNKIFAKNNIQIETSAKLPDELLANFSPSDMVSPASGMKIPIPTRKQTSAEYHSTGINSTKDTSGLRSKITLKTGETSQQLFDSKGMTKI